MTNIKSTGHTPNTKEYSDHSFAMKKEPDITAVSEVRIKLVDPLGRAIAGLRYQIKDDTKIITHGVTSTDGRLAQFNTKISRKLTIEVARFIGKKMKPIREIRPWTEKFYVTLVSGKIKQNAPIVKADGAPGSYRRKTYTVQAGDTLGKISKQHNTSVRALAALNGISQTATIYPGQALRLPTVDRENNSEPHPTKSPIATKVEDERGENGSPKTSVSVACSGACLKIGDVGPLIEELNIRLAGFGGTISPPSMLNEFSSQTENAIKQFQTDYMGIAPTGKVCGSLLLAIDDFRSKYKVNISEMKCPCGKCDGFGNGYTDSAIAGIFSDAGHTKPLKGREYPGMHRSLLWSLRAAIFYAGDKDKDLAYSFLGLSSGYRCWHNNAGYRGGRITSTKRKTTNHMGNALDVQFKKVGHATRCEGSDVDAIRQNIFVKRLGAQLGWAERNKLSLETAAQGATSWVHVDVREYDTHYKDSRFYAVTQIGVDGDLMIEIAKREGKLALVSCGGIALKPQQAATQSNEDRHPTKELSISDKGVTFIKGYEKCNLKPYDDSEGFCTIAWGHLIGRESCVAIKSKGHLKEFESGISQSSADTLLLGDIRTVEQIIKDRVQVPMFQHEYDALVSLIFNLGSFKKCPKLLSKLNTKDYSGCCDEFADITNGGTPGLIKRRSAEMKMFRNKIYDSSH
jgi:GH24 family phage-related lysozyme (muramidase)/LysM repeat protein